MLVKKITFQTNQINLTQNQVCHYKTKSKYQQDIFEKSQQVNFKGNPKILLFEDVAKFIKNGDLEFINKLSDPHIINSELKSLLHISTEEKQIEISKNLLAKGLNVNQKDITGATPFAIACKHQDEAHFNLYLKSNPDINTRDKIGNTPLHNAIHNTKILGALLDRGANPYSKNDFGLPLLHEASVNRESLEYLLKRGVNPDSINDQEQTLLHIASIDGNKKLADMMLNHGAEKNFRDINHKSPLFYSKNSSMVNYWIRQGVEIDLPDNNGKTALNIFVIKRDLNSIFELLKNGANPNNIDKANKSPILYADNNVIRKLLLHFAADPNVKMSDGSTLLHKAVQKNNEEVMNTLLEYKADVNILDGNNKAPLNYATTNKIRKILLENGADPNEKPYLHWALKTDNEEFFNDLLKTDIDVNIEDKSSKTPIFYCKKVEQINKLTKKGAFVNYQDDNGNTPLHYFYASGNTELVNALNKIGTNETKANNNGELPYEFAEKFEKYGSWIK